MSFPRIALSLFLAFSFAWSAEPKAKAPSAKHVKAGVACASCHEEKPPAKPAKMAACVACHGDLAAVAAATKALPVNPHDSHMDDPDCTECHLQHQPPVVKCMQCHANFKLNAK